MTKILAALITCAALSQSQAFAANSYNSAFGQAVASDEISGILIPKQKIQFGANGTAVDVSALNPLPVNASVTVAAAGGRTKVNLIRKDYGSGSVTTSAYVQLIASTAGISNELLFADTSGQTMVIAVGAAASEVDQFYVPQGGAGIIDLLIPSGSRVSVKAVSATASVGELDLTLLN